MAATPRFVHRAVALIVYRVQVRAGGVGVLRITDCRGRLRNHANQRLADVR